MYCIYLFDASVSMYLRVQGREKELGLFVLSGPIFCRTKEIHNEKAKGFVVVPELDIHLL